MQVANRPAAMITTDHRRPPVVVCRPSGPAGQAPPDPYKTGDTAPPWQADAAPVMRPPIHVGARRCLARPRRMAR